MVLYEIYTVKNYNDRILFARLCTRKNLVKSNSDDFNEEDIHIYKCSNTLA